MRRGISLLEVLISMFVLLFGLMGVASIFPVGNHHAGRGDQYDRGAAMTEAAFGELHARGMLRPGAWIYGDGNRVIDPATERFDSADHGHAFVIDPMGAAEPSDVNFPISAGTNPWSLPGQWPIRRLSLPIPDPDYPNDRDRCIKMTTPVAETIFRLRDDLTNELPKEDDRPGIQRWRTGPGNVLLQRQYAGNYSWLATIAPTAARSAVNPVLSGAADLQPGFGMAGSAQFEIAVAVFFKRARTADMESERLLAATLYAGGELAMDVPTTQAETAFADVRAGQWIALAGVNPVNGQFLLKWYRLLSLDAETEGNQRRAMLDGPDWPMAPGAGQATGLRAVILPGIINVSTQIVAMELE